MNQQLASDQETALEALLQYSFGAQELFLPKIVRAGKGSHEPCDLFWSNGGAVVLFYLTSGGKSLVQQDDHNLRQARRWLQRWRTTGVALEGTNRFGDRTSIRARDASTVTCVSVVSHPAGIVFHQSPPASSGGFMCTVSEGLVRTIAAMNGTVVDLLAVINSYADQLGRHLLAHRATGPERLAAVLSRLELRATAVRQRFKSLFESDRKNDVEFVYSILGMNRMPAPYGARMVDSTAARKQIVDFFGDMSATDYLLLAAACVETIRATENARLTIAGRTAGMYLDWNIVATSLRARNAPEFLKEFLERTKGTPMEECPTVIFGYDMEGADYRGPTMFALPPKRGVRQADHLIGRTAARVNQVISARGMPQPGRRLRSRPGQ